MCRTKEKLINNKKGITVIALIVTVALLMILAGVVIGALKGDYGLISIAQKAKEKTEKAAKDEMDILELNFDLEPKYGYVSSNGQLSIKNGQIVNQQGQATVLRGMSAGNGRGIASLDAKYFNKEALSNVKNWGANVFRIPVDTALKYKGYASLTPEDREKMIQRVCEIADICIELDMYVIIDWHTLGENDPNNLKEDSKEFFTKIVNKYKDVPNVIYEICNEPYGVTWDVIKNYANEIIPVIRSVSSDSIIIVGTPNWSHDIGVVIGNELEYPNIAYTFHQYTYWMNMDDMRMLDKVVNNNIAVFVTEWGTAPFNKLDGFFLESSNLMVNYMKAHKISWCNWNMTDGAEALALVQNKKWNNSLNEDILSESGRYVKKLFQNVPMKDLPTMMERKEDYAFWQPTYRENISTVVVEDKIDEQKIKNAVNSWDISYMPGTKKVIAYVEWDRNEYGKYVLYIAGDGGVCASPDSHHLFSYFVNLKNVDVSKLNTSSVFCMSAMFDGCLILEEVNLRSFDTYNVEQMSYMFNRCEKLKKIDLSSFNTTNLKVMDKMFSECYELTNVDLSSFDTKRVINVQEMFRDLSNIQTIDLSNATFENVITYDNMFTNIKNSGVKITVKDSNAKNFIESRLTDAQRTAIVEIKP